MLQYNILITINISQLRSFWHNTGVWQRDRRTDTLLSQRPALA